MKNPEQRKLFNLINQVSFAMDDTRLFLDTHPHDGEALSYFKKMQEVRKQAICEYTRMYGPIVAYDVDNSNTWTWSSEPWPWEVGGC